MIWHDLWTYFGDFDDREFFRILVLAMFLFGIPVAIGLYAKLLGWTVRQIRRCQVVISEAGLLSRDEVGARITD